jgi:hypothetical protein
MDHNYLKNMHNSSDRNVAVDKELLYYSIRSHQPQILLCEQTDLRNKATLLNLCSCAWTEEHLDKKKTEDKY